jgi:hypothetical protein
MHSRNGIVAFLLLAASPFILRMEISAAMPADAPSGRGRTAPAGLDFRLDRGGPSTPAEQAGARGNRGTSRLSVRLYGGLNRIAAGDVNDGADGFFELFELYEAQGYGTAAGGFSPVHGGTSFGADVVYQLSPRLGIGFGIGYLRSSRDSLMSYTDAYAIITMMSTSTLSAVPLRLGLFFSYPVARKINLTAGAGAAYYAGLTLDVTRRVESPEPEWAVISIRGSRRNALANLGCQGSFGAEYSLTPRIGIFFEAVGRYARLKNFDEVTEKRESSDALDYIDTGKLYIVAYSLPQGAHSLFTVQHIVPVDVPPEVIYREPRIDLSGFSVQAGIRIRL